MHLEEKLIGALSPIVDVVKPLVYNGKALEYIVFNYNTYGTTFAESRPTATIYNLQVHHYLPTNSNPYTARKRIIEALHSIGCSWPSVVNASDGDGQHWVFECLYKEGEPNG